MMNMLPTVVMFLMLSGYFATSSPAKPAPATRVVSLNAAMNDELVRTIPLQIAIPTSFKLFPNEPYPGNYTWTTQKSYDALQSTGTTDQDEGLLQLRISTSVGYDRDRDQFICGPGCGEKELVRSMAASGASIRNSDRKRVNDVPVWYVEANIQGGVAYMAYIATLVDTNAVVLTWGPPRSHPEMGDRVWAVIKETMAASKPDAAWKASLHPVKRKTPPISATTKIPQPTARVMKLIDAVARSAAKVGFTTDRSHASDGIVVAKSKDGLSISFRFVDFGEEIVSVMSVGATGEATDKMAQLQRPFLAELATQMPHDYPIVGSDDMMEQLILLRVGQ